MSADDPKGSVHARLRALETSDSVGFVEVNAEGRVTDANCAFSRLIGKPLQQLSSGAVSWTDLVAEDYRREDSRWRQLLASETRPCVWESACVRGDELVVVTVRATPLDGDAWAAFVVDETERRRVSDALRFSEERFRLLVEHVGDAVFMLDEAGRVVTWTPAAQRIFGYEEREALGLTAEDFYVPEERDAGRARDDLRDALTSGRSEADGWRVAKAGERLWAHVVMCPVYGPGGELRGFAQVVQDRSVVRQAEELLQHHTNELERSNRDLERFAAVAAHDLREPLRKLHTFGGRLRHLVDAMPTPSEATRFLDRMDASARRMQHLIDGLLAYARVVRFDEGPETTALDEVVAGVLDDLSSTIEEVGATVEVGPLPTLEVNSLLMRQLFQNLLSNSLKFARDGLPPRLQVRATPEEQGWRIDVEDNGIGFDSGHAERIFEPLERLHSRSAYEGAGLGLAICRRIAETHRGTLTAQGELGRGAVFSIRLPDPRSSAPIMTRRDGK